jgi:ComF family protein
MKNAGMGAFGRLVLETLFPGRCLICGEWLLGRSNDAAPVCTECRALMMPNAGADTCRTCGTRLISEHLQCRRCREGDFAFASNIALFPYAGPVKELVHQLKFSGRTRLAPLFAQWVAAALREHHAGLDVVPVPSRPGKKTPDAVSLIARCLEKSHEVSVERILQRAPGVQQKTLDFAERRENLKGRIFLSPNARGISRENELVVFDDVFTTGATLDACARALREAGYQRVYGMTLVIEE